ncbi:GumC family protein [Gluconacetobacter liquefaciens]|uniref:Uncharacterized protein involved in exopolysaccharide biosynthesis n=1 Tax=Gluconacetobacter liquefaciens TaxID=89584 RepID=A0A370FY77_GLULI|nr:hypothetical protein [Gluconacetobacter liquefaciens]MBB2187598.1 hypothetical protein [Gluconacetobacter liquefaciens]RDI36492.1 uncharacterized protein involved in exopolysaccharide biosynthesis [Gluconacetobacter liquefaciens]
MKEPFQLRLTSRSMSYAQHSLRDILAAVFYYKRSILIAALIPVVLSIMATVTAHRIYTAQARLLILYGGEYVFHPLGQETGGDVAMDRNQIIQGELEILQSPALAEQVIQDVGVRRLYPDLPSTRQGEQQAASRLLRDLRVDAIPQSNILELSLRNQKRQIALDTLDTIIHDYIIYHGQIFTANRDSGPAKLVAQMAARLNAAEDKLVAFSVAHNISDLPQQTSIILRRTGELSDEQTNIISETDNLDAQIKSLESTLSSTPSRIELYSETDVGQSRKTMQDRLARLQIQLADARQRYQDTFPLVVDIQHQINDIKQQIEHAAPREVNVKRSGINNVYDELNQQRILLTSRMAGLRAKRVAIDAEKSALQRRLVELTNLSGQYRNLQTTRDSLTESYRTLENNVEASTIGSSLAQLASANIRVVHPPNASMHGSTLRLPILATGLLLGMIAAVGTLAFLVSTQKIFVTVRDVEHGLHLPVLLSIPVYKK